MEDTSGGTGGSKGEGRVGSGGKSFSESSASELCGWLSGKMTGVSDDRTGSWCDGLGEGGSGAQIRGDKGSTAFL